MASIDSCWEGSERQYWWPTWRKGGMTQTQHLAHIVIQHPPKSIGYCAEMIAWRKEENRHSHSSLISNATSHSPPRKCQRLPHCNLEYVCPAVHVGSAPPLSFNSFVQIENSMSNFLHASQLLCYSPRRIQSLVPFIICPPAKLFLNSVCLFMYGTCQYIYN